METETALKVIADLQGELLNNIFKDERIPDQLSDMAYLGRIGALQLAILKIKIAFGIEL